MTHKRKQRLYFRCNNYSNKAQLRAEASGPYRKTENVDSDNEASGGGGGVDNISKADNADNDAIQAVPSSSHKGGKS